MGRSWTCVFFGHSWMIHFSFKEVRGLGRMAVSDYLICDRCGATKDM